MQGVNSKYKKPRRIVKSLVYYAKVHMIAFLCSPSSFQNRYSGAVLSMAEYEDG